MDLFELTAPLALQLCRHAAADERLAAAVDLIHDLEEALTREFGQGDTRRQADDRAVSDQLLVRRIGDLEDLVRTPHHRHETGRLLEQLPKEQTLLAERDVVGLQRRSAAHHVGLHAAASADAPAPAASRARSRRPCAAARTRRRRMRRQAARAWRSNNGQRVRPRGRRSDSECSRYGQPGLLPRTRASDWRNSRPGADTGSLGKASNSVRPIRSSAVRCVASR